MKTLRAVIWEKLPIVLLVVAVTLTVFGYGVLVGKLQFFPYRMIADGIKTGQSLLEIPGNVGILRSSGFSEVPPDNAAAHRIRIMAGATFPGPLLWYGGHFRFLDLCPGKGCLAVAYTDAGDVAHAWPYRPAELGRAALASTTDEFTPELSPAFSFARDMYPFGMSMYPNRELLVVFHNHQSFPFSGGVARIDSDGRPVWFRRDYSHHWPHLLADGTGLVPGHLLANEDIAFETAAGWPPTADCDYDRPYLDTVNVIDERGHLLQRFNLVDALLRSPFALLLRHSYACDPMHLNYVTLLGPDAGGTWGMAPGDLVVSLRNMNAFAMLDRQSLRLKRLVRGSFFQQHAVTHLDGSTFLLFDNHGSDGTFGPSRLLQIDISTGRETTVFPNAETPGYLRGLHSTLEGKIDISPDRQRAIVVFSQMGVAVEVRLSDGAALNVFRSLHDVSHLEQFDERRGTKAATFYMNGLDYIRPTSGESNE